MGFWLLSLLFFSPALQSEQPEPSGRTSFLASVHVGPEEQFSAIVCILCSVRVEGRVAEVVTVAGNIVVLGQVEGELVAAGGDITLHPGATVADEMVAVGGRVYRDPGVESGEITEVPYLHLAGQRAFHFPGLLVFVASALLLGFIGFLLLGSKRLDRMVESWPSRPLTLTLFGLLSFGGFTLLYTKAELAGSGEDLLTRILQGLFLLACWLGFLAASHALGALFVKRTGRSRFVIGSVAATVLLLVPVAGFFFFLLLFPLGCASLLGNAMDRRAAA